MKIYTSYFANRNIPKNLFKISIARVNYPGYDGLSMSFLSPKYELLSAYKNGSCDVNEFTFRYHRETLNHLEPQVVYNAMKTVSNGRDVVLLCYEKPSKFCHRHLLAQWLSENLDIKISEL